MKIGVTTDAHANHPALVAALDAMDAAGCELIIHTGDAIGIGPHPREVVQTLLSRQNVVCLMGNHDVLFAHDMLRIPPDWISPGELAHQRWTHAQLDDHWRGRVKTWPYVHTITLGNTTIQFQHYAINNDAYGPVSRANVAAELDAAFLPVTDIVFFGHHHPPADVQGRARYINPGALGCNPSQGARWALLNLDVNGSAQVTMHSAPYDAGPVFRDLIDRNVPEAEFIARVFMG